MRQIIVVLFFLIPFISVAQQGNQFSQYMLDKYQWNPAYAGLDNSLSITGTIRSQWSALQGNPKSQSVNAHLPFYKWSAGIGMQIFNEQLGSIQTTGVGFSYGYIKDFDFGLISLAGKASFYQHSIREGELITPDGVYEGSIIEHNDPILSSNNESAAYPKLDIGAYFLSKYMDVGISINDLWKRDLNLGPTIYGLESFVNFFAQAKINLTDKYQLMPSILLKSDFIYTQSDISLMARYNGNVFGGISLRGYNNVSLDAVVIVMGMKINHNYRLSYSYDIGVSGLRNVHEGSHEIMLNYNLNKLIGVGMAPKIIYNPRHL